MALKILSQIGTDQGITSEAYLRIADYNISKQGCSANFSLQLYLSEADAHKVYADSAPYDPRNPKAHCQLIGSNLYISFQKEIEVDSTCTRLVPKDPIPNEAPGVINTVVPVEYVEETYPCKQKVIVCDLSPVESTDIFQFGYSELKAKMVSIFGAENVVDC